jgi:hypothetical protein
MAETIFGGKPDPQAAFSDLGGRFRYFFKLR